MALRRLLRVTGCLGLVAVARAGSALEGDGIVAPLKTLVRLSSGDMRQMAENALLGRGVSGRAAASVLRQVEAQGAFAPTEVWRPLADRRPVPVVVVGEAQDRRTGEPRFGDVWEVWLGGSGVQNYDGFARDFPDISAGMDAIFQGPLVPDGLDAPPREGRFELDAWRRIEFAAADRFLYRVGNVFASGML